ncbi:hypothetical protein [Sapientia aquatica]|nr:hypothetical protein [Sapientia aquatica]
MPTRAKTSNNHLIDSIHAKKRKPNTPNQTPSQEFSTEGPTAQKR